MPWSDKPLWRGVALAMGGACLVSAAPPAMDPVNPTCPASLNWSNYPEMRFTFAERNGRRVLLAEGKVDAAVEARLADAIETHKPIHEIWLRSSGGNARVGNEVGRLVRSLNLNTRIPSGWACFSACNFIFMGGRGRMIEPGGLFVAHMFTHLSDEKAITEELRERGDGAIELIGDVEQGSALLASEDNDFLVKMQISRKLLTDIMYRQKAIAGSGDDRSTRRCLTTEELALYRVTNIKNDP